MMGNEERQVLEVIGAMTDAFHQCEIAGVMAAYHPGAVIVFEPGKPASGDAALRAGFEMFFSMRPRFTYRGHEVLVAGDTALHLAPWTMHGTSPDGRAIINSGLSVAVLRRGPEGAWKMVIDNPFGGRLLD